MMELSEVRRLKRTVFHITAKFYLTGTVPDILIWPASTN